MRRLIVPLAAALLLLAGASQARPRKDSPDDCKGVSESAAALSLQYRELRARRRTQPEGQFDRDLNASGGKLEEVLSRLGVELGRRPYTRETIVRCMGEPDAVRVGRRMGHLLDIYNNELRKAGRKVPEGRDREYLIYFWRGWHDLLFFIVERGAVVDHGWWFAYE